MSFRYRILSTVLVVAIVSVSRAQQPPSAPRGIPSEGRDFYVGIMPPIKLKSDYMPQSAYILVGSLQDNDTVNISYFDGQGEEFTAGTQVITRGRTWKFSLDLSSVYPSSPGEIAEYKAAHITSKYPVSVQVYEEGSSSGEMYEAIPTDALGENYVVASWSDNPIPENPVALVYQADSHSEFEIVAAFDNTAVVYTPNTTTARGIVGVNTGGLAGIPHPAVVHLNRGQVYWVRSTGDNSLNDMTGSTITSNKPIAVLGGQERALLGDPSLTDGFVSQSSDVRNMLVEEMMPAESWDSEYVSIPFLPPQYTGADQLNGYGDMYRALSDQANTGTIAMWSSLTDYIANLVAPYSNVQYSNITNAEDFMTESRDTQGFRLKQSVVMYDYFMGNGTANITVYTLPDEMDLIGLSHWKASTVFEVPQNGQYRGAQFINVITQKDSLPKIDVSFNGNPPITLDSFSKLKTYAIPLHPELTGITCQLPSGDYMIWGNTPFACYSYGRTELQTQSSVWAYAAPCGMLYTFGANTRAQLQVTPSCDHWTARVIEGGSGIADIMLLDDPNGLYVRPAHVSYNTSLSPQPVFMPGDTSVSFTIQIQDPSQNAYAAVLVTGRSGSDTVFEFHYTPSATISSTSVSMLKTMVGTERCATFALGVVNSGMSDTVTISPPTFTSNDTSFTVTTTPVLPALLHVGDSVRFTICFQSGDTLSHTDSLTIPIGCWSMTVRMSASGVTPIIYASDYDFGSVPVGQTACHTINVKNIGNSDLILDKNWMLRNTTTEFSFSDNGVFPITLAPGQSADLEFCFHPTSSGGASAVMDWTTNIPSAFAHQVKDSSILTGNATLGVAEQSAPRFGINALQPDPAKSQITVWFHVNTPSVELEIFDVLGRRVWSERVAAGEGRDEQYVDLHEFVKGSYILRMSSGGSVASERFEIE